MSVDLEINIHLHRRHASNNTKREKDSKRKDLKYATLSSCIPTYQYKTSWYKPFLQRYQLYNFLVLLKFKAVIMNQNLTHYFLPGLSKNWNVNYVIINGIQSTVFILTRCKFLFF